MTKCISSLNGEIRFRSLIANELWVFDCDITASLGIIGTGGWHMLSNLTEFAGVQSFRPVELVKNEPNLLLFLLRSGELRACSCGLIRAVNWPSAVRCSMKFLKNGKQAMKMAKSSWITVARYSCHDESVSSGALIVDIHHIRQIVSGIILWLESVSQAIQQC
jgi:hypothetical protein